MKNLGTLILLYLVSFTVSAQKVIEKQLTTKADNIEVEFKFADDIILKTWDKNEIYIKAVVSVNQGEFDDYFDLKVDNTSSILEIESTYGDLFKKQNEIRKARKDGKWNPCDNLDIDAKYTLYVPKTLRLRVKSISGSVASENYEGELDIDIISGDIDIKDYEGELRLKTISGDIDIHIAKSSLLAETITGMIYSDKDMEFDQGKNRVVGSKVTGTFGDAKSRLHLKTISGSIYLRKQ